MSLFGSLMGDIDDDPFFGAHMQSMRNMNNMMNSLFSDPLRMLEPPALTGGSQRRNRMHDMQMMPFGFPPMPSFDMGRIFADFENMSSAAAASGNCHSFMSSSVMTMGRGPDGRPQVYQESMSTRTAPGGIKETKKTVCDSRTGTKKMAIGHHIGERAHILEREQNIHNGDEEERQEFINLDEDEADTFNQEWQQRTRHSTAAISGNYEGRGSHRERPQARQLALPAPSTSRQSNRTRWAPSPRRSIKSVNSKAGTTSPYGRKH